MSRLHYSVQKSNPALVQKIYDRLIDVGVKPRQEQLLTAIKNGNHTLLVNALEHVDPNFGSHHVVKSDQANRIRNPLALAVHKLDLEAARMLIAAGADTSRAVALVLKNNEYSLYQYALKRKRSIDHDVRKHPNKSQYLTNQQTIDDFIVMLKPEASANEPTDGITVAVEDSPAQQVPVVPVSVPDNDTSAQETSAKTVDVSTLIKKMPYSGLQRLMKTYSERISSLLSDITPLPIFLSGPYPEGFLNREKKGHFGRYNPDFLRWVIDDVLDENDFANSYYQRQSWVRLIYQQRQYLKNHPVLLAEYVDDYQQALKTGEGLKGYHSRAYREAHGGLRQASAIAFWVRRQVDGTALYFDEIFEHLLTRYDNEYWLSLQQPQETGSVDTQTIELTTTTLENDCEVAIVYEGVIPDQLFGYLRIDESNPDKALVFVSNRRYSKYPKGEIPCVGNRRIWIFNEGKAVPGEIISARVKHQQPGLLELSIKAESSLQSGIVPGEPMRLSSYVYLSSNPLPEQTWSSSKVLYKTHKRAVEHYAIELGISNRLRFVRNTVIQTQDGREYLLINYTEHYDAATGCKNTYYCVVTLLLKLTDKGDWEIESEFRTANYGRPYVDIDGDGLPEFIGITGSKSMALSSLAKPADGKQSFGFLIDSGN